MPFFKKKLFFFVALFFVPLLSNTVYSQPVITEDPQSQTALSGESITISVDAISNCGQGFFEQPQFNPLDTLLRDLVVTDLNSDGLADIASSHGTNNSNDFVSVYLATGVNTFSSPVYYLTQHWTDSGDMPTSIRAADVNNDGIKDLIILGWNNAVCCNPTTASITTILGNGDGTFGLVTEFPIEPLLFKLYTEDFNNDGFMDYLAEGSGAILYYGDGLGGSSSSSVLPTGTTIKSAIGDINQDSFIDVVCANYHFTHDIDVFQNNSPSPFQIIATFDVGSSSVSTGVAMGDINNDGFIDIYSLGGTPYFWAGDGQGTFSVGQPAPGSGNLPIAITDLNNDGISDIIALDNVNDSFLYVTRGNSSGGFDSANSIHFGLSGPSNCYLVNFNNDGVADLVCIKGSGYYTLHGISEPLSYQWKKDGLPISGATESTLVLSAATPEDSGTYSVSITNPCGTTTSAGAQILITCVNDVDCDGIIDNCDVDFTAGADCDMNGEDDSCQTDTDLDGTIDACDNCPNDGDKIEPGLCGCGVVEDDDCDDDSIPNTCDADLSSEPDCNANGIIDGCDINSGHSPDCNGNAIPDECEYNGAEDCNSNGLLDECDIILGISGDCNFDNVPDECEISNGTAADCNSNGVPDRCDFAVDPDCNSNSVIDECDIIFGLEEDCDSNGLPDSCELNSGAPDCDSNGQLDTCQIDTDSDGAIDPCDDDLDGDGIPNACDVDQTLGADCDLDGQDDSCQIDTDSDGTIDPCDDDIDGDGIPNTCDINQTSGADCDLDGQDDSCQLDTDSDGTINPCDEDIDGDEILNSCDTDFEIGDDCNQNGIVDECEIAPQKQSPQSLLSYYFDIPETNIPGSNSLVRCLLDNNTEFGISDWTLGVCEDTAQNGYNIVSANAGLAVSMGNNGSQIDFHEIQVCPGEGVYQSALVNLSGLATLPAGTEIELATIEIEITGYLGSTSSLEYCSSSLSCSITENYVTYAGISYIPELISGTVQIIENSIPDCNSNGALDDCEINSGSTPDCDGNFVPDECQPDLDNDGVIDPCDDDIDGDGFPNTCDVDETAGSDCDSDGQDDSCQKDTDLDGTIDVCDIDLDGDGIPNECDSDQVSGDDCNSNGILDHCDIAGGAADANSNGVPDECEETPFIRCDVNGDGGVDIGDAIAALDYLFTGGSITCNKAADSNDDGAIDVADGIQILGYLFSGTGDLPDPFPACGVDPTPDALECESYNGC